jgi:FKBP-type peptidyl-prolyl cis-trans isomerase FkpA
MRTLVIWSTLLILATAVNAGADESKLETDDQKTLYALGLTIYRSLSPFNLSPSELQLVEAGLADGSLHNTPKVDLETYGPKIKQFQEARAAAVAGAEKKTSQIFVDQAAREPGATKTASGLVMIPITPGTGASPQGTDTVTVNYEGRLTDGTVFDSSRQHGGPATVPLNGVIKCWTEALQLVKVGGKSRLVCPADLAYGDQGWPPLIKPGATLVFEVELLRISQPSAQTAPQSGQASFWYYCNDAQAYYPYVRQCPSGWLQVVPQTTPPGQQDGARG